MIGFPQFEYFYLFIYILLAIALAIIIYLVSVVSVPRWADEEKLSAYECGFSPSGDARNKVEIKFYLTAILFIVFDVEIVFLFPWVLVMTKNNGDLLGFLVMCIFFGVVVLGYIYEWLTGAMDW